MNDEAPFDLFSKIIPHPTWRVIPVRKWLINSSWLINGGYWPLTSPGMILQLRIMGPQNWPFLRTSWRRTSRGPNTKVHPSFQKFVRFMDSTNSCVFPNGVAFVTGLASCFNIHPQFLNGTGILIPRCGQFLWFIRPSDFPDSMVPSSSKEPLIPSPMVVCRRAVLLEILPGYLRNLEIGEPCTF